MFTKTPTSHLGDCQRSQPQLSKSNGNVSDRIGSLPEQAAIADFAAFDDDFNTQDDHC